MQADVINGGVMQESTEKIIRTAKEEYMNPTIIIVTGYSGAGKNTVLRALEDTGFFCVDNLPIALLNAFFQLVSQAKIPVHKIALGLDVRGQRNFNQCINELYTLRDTWGLLLQLVFVKSSPEILLKRFQETRRPHPLAQGMDVADAIMHEQQLLKPLLESADLIVDTDQLTIHQVRNFIRSLFALSLDKTMLVSLTSFGFKYGVPAESNLVIDVRFLPNPYFVSDLKMLVGTDQRVLDYLFKQVLVQEYWQKFVDFIGYSIAKMSDEGRSFVHIAIGCTGGKHRSVAFVHTFAQQHIPRVQLLVKHRDMYKDIEQKEER
jgi:UPF0042 nucleotide-binding protein